MAFDNLPVNNNRAQSGTASSTQDGKISILIICKVNLFKGERYQGHLEGSNFYMTAMPYAHFNKPSQFHNVEYSCYIHLAKNKSPRFSLSGIGINRRI